MIVPCPDQWLGQMTAYQVIEREFVSANLWICGSFWQIFDEKVSGFPSGTTGGPTAQGQASKRPLYAGIQ
jgi:hypothetical protein